MKSLTTILALLALPLIAAAQSNQSYECTMANLVRRVAVEREDGLVFSGVLVEPEGDRRDAVFKHIEFFIQ